jgi:hypothetical protein
MCYELAGRPLALVGTHQAAEIETTGRVKMNLNHFKAASSLIESMKAGPQYVKITAGPRENTIGRVMSVRSKYYSAHDYQLSVAGRRSFWAKGSDLEHLRNHTGGTHYAYNGETPVYNDLMGRRLEVNQTILFPRGTEGARVDMVMGTIQKVSARGAIYARLFKSGQGNDLHEGMVRVGKPGSAMIIDRGTMDTVLLAKLAAF